MPQKYEKITQRILGTINLKQKLGFLERLVENLEQDKTNIRKVKLGFCLPVGIDTINANPLIECGLYNEFAQFNAEKIPEYVPTVERLPLAIDVIVNEQFFNRCRDNKYAKRYFKKNGADSRTSKKISSCAILLKPRPNVFLYILSEPRDYYGFLPDSPVHWNYFESAMAKTHKRDKK